MLPRVGADDQMLTPILKIAEWGPVRLGQPGDAQIFGVQLPLVAEGATHVR
ncbi:hypothetical protein D3C87_1513980 [compost metagenome]